MPNDDLIDLLDLVIDFNDLKTKRKAIWNMSTLFLNNSSSEDISTTAVTFTDAFDSNANKVKILFCWINIFSSKSKIIGIEIFYSILCLLKRF